ncbi:MAG: hypothetical protein E6G27_03585 [Actinobacteria bacterium]|nr:MAG: hypothetical protein E6G27_03585 [Actinomycetota bacterium]
MLTHSEHVSLQEGSGTFTHPVSRSTAPVLTEISQPALEEVWPEVSARLSGVLRRRLDAATVEDIVQETALRVVRSQVAFSSADDLLRWATRVGKNLAVDIRRRRRFIDAVPVPEQAGPHNVAAVVDHRITLDAVSAAMKRLSEVDRSAILTTPPSRSRHESNRQYAARHRARSHLRALLQGLVAVAGLLARRLRPTLRSQVLLAAAVIFPVALVATVRGHGSAPGRIGPRIAASATFDPGGSAQAAPPAVDPRPAPSAPPGRREARPPSPDAPLLAGHVPPTSVQAELPMEHRVKAVLRPAEPEDHLVCVSARVVSQCVESPLKPSADP